MYSIVLNQKKEFYTTSSGKVTMSGSVVWGVVPSFYLAKARAVPLPDIWQSS